MMKKELTSFGQWHLVKPLGSGAFGEVHHWKNRETGYEIATKLLKDNPKLKPDEMNILSKRWLQEYQWMLNLHTNFIVGAVSINDSKFLKYLNAEQSFPVIIMEYCNGGDLRRHLNKVFNLNGLKEFEVRHILFSLLRATEYLHEKCNIEHRDIKPENVVIHITGSKTMYKLADFGYAREIPESTIAQSVVGTSNYVALEVIDTGIYTKSVDYWSIGILAYEIICGIRPFIPHQTFVNRMKNIQKKPKQCIAIIQNIDNLSSEHFEFVNNIKTETHLSNILLTGMEKWLRLALETNYKTRGRNNNNELTFYSDLDTLLRKKILTVFSLKTFKKYYYDIELYDSAQSFINEICSDNQIDIRNIYFILPPLHPKKHVQNLIDYFVEEWCDTTNPDNPPAMLFVTEFFIKTDCDIDVENYFTISEAIKKCMCLNAENDNMENIVWLLQYFERDVHFVISECQHLLECYMMGLYNFIIDIDHVVCTFNGLETLVQRISQLRGSINHSNVVLNEYIKVQREEAVKLAKDTAQMFDKKCQDLARNIIPQLKATHKEILQKCQDLAKNQIYEHYAKSDVFELAKFQNFISLNRPPAERLEYIQSVFDKCIQEFIRFTKNSQMKAIRASLNEQIQKNGLLRQRVHDVMNIIFRLENELENFTRSLVTDIISDKLSASINAININEATSSSPVTNNTFLNDCDMDSKMLIEECETLCNVMFKHIN